MSTYMYQWWGAEQHEAGRCPTYTLIFVVVPEHHNAGGFPALVHVHVVAFVVIPEQNKDGIHVHVVAFVVIPEQNKDGIHVHVVAFVVIPEQNKDGIYVGQRPASCCSAPHHWYNVMYNRPANE